MSRFRLPKNRFVRVLIIFGCVFGIALGGVGFWAYRQLSLSLPLLDGRVSVAGIQSDVSVERDALGIPTISAKDRHDLAFATGFVHAQDRFFHMDLLRRNAAGELSELIGPALVDRDKQTRIHRFRAAAKRNLELEGASTRQMIKSYEDVVNAGLQ
ncbi:MAG: penicillin acylase family protein [Pirellula sp.]